MVSGSDGGDVTDGGEQSVSEDRQGAWEIVAACSSLLSDSGGLSHITKQGPREGEARST